MINAQEGLPAKPNWRLEVLVVALLCLTTGAVYWIPSLRGSDFYTLHLLRLRFARAALFGPEPTLPAWYPGQLLGTPFWSNVQNFPFIPTRLLLLPLDPDGPYTYALGIVMAACLAAVFTYLFARRIGIGVVGSAAAGWTFACCGFFSARVTAGHLAMLEVYCALPLLLWSLEGLFQAQNHRRPIARWLAILAGSTTVVSLAGHPQLPTYALATSIGYAIFRIGFRRALVPLGVMTLGIGCAGFALVPMTCLIARSTRVLPLPRAYNDVAMPFRRLLGFWLPWNHGVRPPVPGYENHPDYDENPTYFWETFCYAGWAPWLALLFLGVLWIARPKSQKPLPIAWFIIAMGVAGTVLALPFVQNLTSLVPATVLRGPSRLIYLTELALALGLGAAISKLLAPTWGYRGRALVIAVLLWQAIDVTAVTRRLLFRESEDAAAVELNSHPLLSQLKSGRIAVDFGLSHYLKHSYDNIGFFDSIMLARSYHLLLDLSGLPANSNVQLLDAGAFPARTLEATGVKLVVTFEKLPELKERANIGSIRLYTTAMPAERAAFFSWKDTRFTDDAQLRAAIRTAEKTGLDLRSQLLLPQSAYPKSIPDSRSNLPPSVHYRRTSTDQIECLVETGQFGYLRVIESWDPGWHATLDDQPVSVVPALGALLAVPVPPGKHRVIFNYHTPGWIAGVALSALSVLTLIVTLRLAKRLHLKEH